MANWKKVTEVPEGFKQLLELERVDSSIKTIVISNEKGEQLKLTAPYSDTFIMSVPETKTVWEVSSDNFKAVFDFEDTANEFVDDNKDNIYFGKLVIKKKKIEE